MRAIVPFLLLVSSCAVGPDFHRPSAWLPTNWFDSSQDRLESARRSLPAAAPVDPTWWRSFGDPTLTQLCERAAAENLDVQSATIRLAESRQERGIAAAGLFPQVNGAASYQGSKVSPKGVYGLLEGLLNGRPSGNSAFPPAEIYSDSLDAVWQLDIWGKVRREVESADASVEASADNRRGVLLMAIAEIATDYVALRNVQAQIAIARRNLQSSQQSLDLTRRRNNDGTATSLDVNNAAAQVERIAAQLPSLEDQQEQTMNALSLLLGAAPGTLKVELVQPKPLPPVPPRVPVGLPSDLARRRPDIREAEAQLHAATAEIGVAQADFYPNLSLTGSFGFQALNLQNFGNWAARTWTVGPVLELPIFQGGRLTSTLRLRKAQEQEAAIAYRRTVLRAWHEIANALSAYDAEQRRRERLAHDVEYSRRALELAQLRYREGVADFLNVLDAERTVLSAEQSLADSTAKVSTNLIVLYKALGGGWDTAFPDTNDALTRQVRRSPYGTVVWPEGQ